ncbi:MAG: TetR/AcrR family transcriptional regulator [Bacteroidetes bacterium]|nr:TetR/AcrR family transcriptional regulator [Bacteroidota bacterium]
MGILERKEKEKIDLRKRILDAARELFLEKGYEHTSIRNIAERIEYSPTTIYLYFKDKDSIFLELHNEGFNILGNRMSVLASVEDPMERLKAMGRIYIQFAKENPDFYDLMFVQNAPMDCLEHEHWEAGEGAFGFLKSTVKQCIEHGYLPFHDAEIGAFVVWSTMHGMCTLDFRERCQVLSDHAQTNTLEKGLDEFIRLMTTK